MTTIHANNPRDAIRRLETLVLMAGVDLPERAIREQIGSAIHLIVDQSHFADGTRKVSSIMSVEGVEGPNAVPVTNEIFRFDHEGLDKQGSVGGQHVPTGVLPSFVDKLKERGFDIRKSLFTK